MLVHGIKAIGLSRTSAKVAVICAIVCAAFGAWGAGTSAATFCINEEFGYAPNVKYTCVVYIQGMLNLLRATRADAPWIGGSGQQIGNLVTDGYYGNQTFEAVKGFQLWTGLTRDGITGPQTWGQLCLKTYTRVYMSKFSSIFAVPASTAFHKAGCPDGPFF